MCLPVNEVRPDRLAQHQRAVNVMEAGRRLWKVPLGSKKSIYANRLEISSESIC